MISTALPDLFGVVPVEAAVPREIAVARNNGRWNGRGYDWATPTALYRQLDKEFGFTLDVCASDWNKKHHNFYSEKDNGLLRDWESNICFMNPPYGRQLYKWMAKAFESSLNGATVVCLVPAATDSEWWHRYALKGAIRYLRGRPRFRTRQNTWQQIFTPSVLVIFKP